MRESHYRLTNLQHLPHQRLGLFSSRVEILSRLDKNKFGSRICFISLNVHRNGVPFATGPEDQSYTA